MLQPLCVKFCIFSEIEIIFSFSKSLGSVYVPLLNLLVTGNRVPEVLFVNSRWRKSQNIIFLGLPGFSVSDHHGRGGKRRKSTCSYYEDEDEAALPTLQPHSASRTCTSSRCVLPGMRVGPSKPRDHLLFSLGVESGTVSKENPSSLTKTPCFRKTVSLPPSWEKEDLANIHFLRPEQNHFFVFRITFKVCPIIVLTYFKRIIYLRVPMVLIDQAQ